jgi:hypothetical protein
MNNKKHDINIVCVGAFMEIIDYSQLKNNLKETVYKIYNNYKSEHNIKDICALALFSDDDAMSISLAINTYENLQNSINDDFENKLYYKFSPEERSEIIENSELDKINKTLEKTGYKIKKKQFVEHKEKIYKLCFETLDELKNEHLFDGLNDDFVLLFSVSDSDCLFYEKIIEYNKKYNAKNISEEYEQWIKEEMEYEADDE